MASADDAEAGRYRQRREYRISRWFVYRLDHLNFHLRRLGVDLVLDVGAAAGGFARDLRAHGYRGSIISFESGAKLHSDLEAAAATDPLWKIAPLAAAAAGDGGHMAAVNAVTAYLRHEFSDPVPRFALKLAANAAASGMLDAASAVVDRCDIVLVEMPIQFLEDSAGLFEIHNRFRSLGLVCVGLQQGRSDRATGDAVDVHGLFVRRSRDPAALPSPTIHLFTSIPPRMSRIDRDGVTDVGAAYQAECVQSWVDCGFKVVSINPASESAAVAAMDLPLDILETKGDGKPSIADFAAEIRRLRPEVCGIINADCRMLDTPDLATTLRAGASDGIVIVERIDVLHGRIPVPFSPAGFDLFLFPGSALERLPEPPFSIGETWWDFWFPYALAATGLKVRNLATPILTHYKHDLAWNQEQWRRKAQVFWTALRAWRAATPGIFSGLDDELGELWNRETLIAGDAPRLAQRSYRWLHENDWKPAGGLEPAIPPGLAAALLQAFRAESEEAWRLRGEEAELQLEIRKLNETAVRLNATIKDLDALCKRQHSALEEIKSSLAWHVSKPIRMLSNAVKRPKLP